MNADWLGDYPRYCRVDPLGANVPGTNLNRRDRFTRLGNRWPFAFQCPGLLSFNSLPASIHRGPKAALNTYTTHTQDCRSSSPSPGRRRTITTTCITLHCTTSNPSRPLHRDAATHHGGHPATTSPDPSPHDLVSQRPRPARVPGRPLSASRFSSTAIDHDAHASRPQRPSGRPGRRHEGLGQHHRPAHLPLVQRARAVRL